MGVNVIVKYETEGKNAMDIRTLFCQVASTAPDNQNPLEKTNFNELLSEIVQSAFDAGRYYEKEN